MGNQIYIKNQIIHYLGFGDGETYPFESDHGTELNGTIVEGNTQREKMDAYMILT